MQLEAKTLERGFWKKYLFLSLKMTLRGLPQWLFLIGMFYLYGQVKTHFVINIVFGFWMVFFGLSVAHNAYDAKGYSVDAFSESFQESLMMLIHHLKTRIVDILIIVGLFFVLVSIGDMTNDTAESIKRKAELESFWTVFTNGAWSFTLSIWLINGAFRLGIFSPLLIKFYDIKDESINKELTLDAARKNWGLTISKEMLYFTLMVCLNIPYFSYVIMLVFVMYSNFMYLCYRGVFMNDKGLELKQKKEVENSLFVMR